MQELFVQVLQEFHVALRLSMQETKLSLDTFEEDIAQVLQQTFGSSALPSNNSMRLATAGTTHKLCCYEPLSAQQ